MVMDKELTILILTYNRYVYTKYTLDAVALYADFSCIKEILVGDAGSTDGTRDLVEQYDFVDQVYDVPYGSVVQNIRKGIELSTGKYLLHLGNDMIVSKDWNRKALEALKAAEKHGIRILNYDMPDGDLYEATHGGPLIARLIGKPYRYSEPIAFDGFSIQPTWQAGGLYITTRELMLSSNCYGSIGSMDSGIYFGFWFWHLGFQGQIAARLPRLGTFLIEYAEKIPPVLQHMAKRLDEPIIKDLLKEGPAELRKEYIAKGWMREVNYAPNKV